MVGDVRPALLIMLAAVGFVLLDRLRERRQPGADRRARPPARAGGAHGARRRPRPPGPGPARRERVCSRRLAERAGCSSRCGARASSPRSTPGSTSRCWTRPASICPSRRSRWSASALSAVLFGTLPAWHAAQRLDIMRGIKADAGTTMGDRDRQRLRGGLIVLEAALSVVLLVGAGPADALVPRPHGRRPRLRSVTDPDVQPVAAAHQLSDAGVPRHPRRGPDQRDRRARRTSKRQRPSPACRCPNYNYTISTSTIDGRTLDRDDQMRRSMQVRVVTADYFRVMGIPMLEGRTFQPADGSGAPPVIVVNRAAAAVLWPDTAPLGRSMTLGTRLGQGGGTRRRHRGRPRR